MIKGLVHSIEPFGTVDGPGIRMVVFLSGCPLRCNFCHNPEIAWSNQGELLTVEDLAAEYTKNHCFYQSGGLTFSGGEPLVQGEFLLRAAQHLSGHHIHLAVDTSLGCGYNWIDKLLPYIDLWMVSIKAIDPILHQQVTGHHNQRILSEISKLNATQANMVVRYVILPGYSDTAKELTNLARYLKTLAYPPPLELLPYHSMGVSKWEAMNREYQLKDIPEATKTHLEQAKALLRDNGITNFHTE